VSRIFYILFFPSQAQTKVGVLPREARSTGLSAPTPRARAQPTPLRGIRFHPWPKPARSLFAQHLVSVSIAVLSSYQSEDREIQIFRFFLFGIETP